MNIINENEKKIIDNLYNEVRNILLSKLDNQNFNYKREQLYLPHEKYCPGTSENYYNEKGCVSFQNINGEIINIEISRWHEAEKNEWYNYNPCLIAKIYKIKDNKKQILFELNVESNKKTYIGKISDKKIPTIVLEEKEIIKNNKTLLNKVTDLNNKYMLLEQIKSEKINERNKKIDYYVSKIKKEYIDKLEKIEEKLNHTKKETEIFNNLLKKYSTFNLDIIGNAIKDLMNLVENDEYVYLEIDRNLDKFKKFVQFDKNKITNIIINKEKINNLNEWYEDSLVLSKNDIKNYNKNITFYTFFLNYIRCNIDYDKFGYIKDFIDNIIEYRFNNNLIEFTEKDMLLFMKDYVTKNKDNIVNYYFKDKKYKTK